MKEGERWLLHFHCVLAVMWLLVFCVSSSQGGRLVCDCCSSWSYSHAYHVILQMRPQNEKVQMTQKQHKELKDLRKQIALSKVNNITKVHI